MRSYQYVRTKGFVFLSNLLNPLTQSDGSVIEKFRTQDTSKARTYKEINPEMKVHNVYKSTEYINERERLSFTRFRLSSHHLKIETGRWARIEVEERLCDCGNGIQDERHVLLTCLKTESERRRYGIGEDTENVGALMEMMNVHDLVSFVHSCMKHFK